MKFRKKKIAATVQTLITDTDNALESLMGSGESADQLLTRLGVSRQQAFETISSDDEVESCREDLRTAMLSKTFRLWGEDANDDEINRLWRIMRKHLPVLVEAVLTAKLNGYAVIRYVYEQEEDGFLSVGKVSDKSTELDKYTPKADGSLTYYSDNGEVTVDTNVVFLLLTNRATSTNPAGEMAGARLYPAVAIRKQGFIYAAQFIKRYAQPYMVGYVEGETETFSSKLFSFIAGGAIAVNREDRIEMLQNNADGQAFQRLEQVANRRIQKALLGKVKTSDLENGSRAAQETEEETKGDRIDGYLYMLGLAAQHMVDALLMVNEAYGKTIHAPKGLWFEFNKKTEIDIKRADRDTKYAKDANLRFTEDYYIDVLGFEPNHFVLAEEATAPTSGNASLSARLSDKYKQGNPLNAFSQPKIDAIASALDECESFADFEAKLSGMDLSEGDNALIQRVLGDAVHEFIKGSEAQNHG
ncbi:MAG TPA: hypothetical protein PK856_01055 [Vitreoscilla sp.]|nr:hypothetical protein [Vitreoscilla sp.]